MEIQEGQLFSETGLEHSKRRITALGYFERVDVSTEQGSAPDKIIINFEVGREAHRHVPGRRRLQLDRELHRHRAGAAGQPLRQRAVARAAGAGLGAAAARHACASSSRTSSTRDWTSSAELFDTLYVFPDFARRSVGGSLTFGYALIQPWLRLSAHGHAPRRTRSTRRRRRARSSAPTPGFSSVFQQLPLANLFNDGRVVSLRPTITYDTRDNRLFPTSGIFLQASTELATQRARAASSTTSATASRGASTTRSAAATGMPGSGFVLKLNTEVGLITSPEPAGRAHLRSASSSAASSTCAASTCAASARACRSTTALDPNAAPIANGANIGGNLEAYENLELEFPIIDKVGIRGVVFFDAGNAWNTRAAVLQDDARARSSTRSCSPASASPAASAYLRTSTGFGIRWFSPLGPLRFEWGFPLAPLPYENHSDFEFTIGNFF